MCKKLDIAEICVSYSSMIIDFTVTNFRSIQEEQSLSFVASNYDKSLSENLISPDLKGGDLPKLRLLKGLAIYGANAAGKTNVLLALQSLKDLVLHSADSNEGDELEVEPFAFDGESSTKPTEFVLRFIVEKTRFHYILVLNHERVLFESLSAFPKKLEQVWFAREWNEETHEYIWTPEKPTGFKRDSTRVSLTRSNSLFLSNAVKLNDEQLKPIYLWFRNKLQFLRLNAEFPPLPPVFTAEYVCKNANKRAQITHMMRHADFGLLSVSANERKVQKDDIPSFVPEEMKEQIMKTPTFDIQFGHKGEEGKEYSIQWEEESSGTQKLFSLAAPWLDSLENGYITSIDEIESSLHPAIVNELLKLWFSEDYNQNDAQIIFTTHNPLLLDPELIRRDQIWFAEKDDEGGTHLTSLLDYKARGTESLAKGYMEGRYGGIPFIPDGLLGGSR